jgi:hypothetical protein
LSVRLAFSIALLSILLVLAGLWVGENVDLLPLQASINAPVYDELFQVLFSIGTMLFIGVTGLLIYAMVRFRRSAGDLGDGAAIEGNLPLEIVWTAIPAVVVLFVHAGVGCFLRSVRFYAGSFLFLGLLSFIFNVFCECVDLFVFRIYSGIMGVVVEIVCVEQCSSRLMILADSIYKTQKVTMVKI